MNKRILVSRIFFSLIIGFFTCQSHATIEADMQSFFDKIGANANVTPGGAYKGQEGGFYTGGSVFARIPAREVQMVNMQMPNIGAGCNGIDIFTGGIGFIDASRLIETMKAIGANGAGYAFSLALKQMSPQIMNQIEEFMAIANGANWNNINSCQMAMGLVNNGAAMFHETGVRTCIQSHLNQGSARDYIEARDKCKTQAAVNAQNKAALSDPSLKDSTISNVNIVWRAIQNNGALAHLHDDLKYFLMSLTGTVIIRSNNNGSQKQIYPSKLYKDEIFSHHKTFKVHACADEHATANGCLNIVDKTITLSDNKSFIGRVREILKAMEQKVEDDLPLTVPERAFLESTALPVYKMLNVHSAFSRGLSLMFPSEYAEVIAMDILYRYVDTGISDVMEAFNNNLLPKELRADFFDMVEKARQQIKTLRAHHLKKMVHTQDMIAKVQMMEKQVSALISSEHFNDFDGDFGG
ncbi:MAG TPA: conjugal transfer protein TraH [Gammaproteobacteria bacterium]|nr:conjugal transfer protein TraH [Gammaproteobacteria bacterium]